VSRRFVVILLASGIATVASPVSRRATLVAQTLGGRIADSLSGQALPDAVVILPDAKAALEALTNRDRAGGWRPKIVGTIGDGTGRRD
jgi:hypothetical protein